MIELGSRRASKGGPGLERLRSYLLHQLAEIERNDPVVRMLGSDAESLHDLRVAVRRSRVVLRAAREVFDETWLKSLRAELRWLACELAPARDQDVLWERLVEERAESDPDVEPILKLLETDRRRARARLMRALESKRYVRLVDKLRNATVHPPVRATDLSLERIAAREFGRLKRSIRALGPRPSDAALHCARIRAKRARYAAEMIEPIAGKRARKFIAAAKAFQDTVGTHQDAVVAEELIRAVATRSNSTEVALAAGRVIERQRARRERVRGSLPRTLKKLERRGREAWT